MASKVGPSVATAAAKAAIAALCDEASCPKEIFDTGDSTNDRFDSLTPQFVYGLASHVIVEANLENFAHRADRDKDTDMEEQQEEKGNLCSLIQCTSLGVECKAQDLRFVILIVYICRRDSGSTCSSKDKGVCGNSSRSCGCTGEDTGRSRRKRNGAFSCECNRRTGWY